MDNCDNCLSLGKKGMLNPDSTSYHKMTCRWINTQNVKNEKETVTVFGGIGKIYFHNLEQEAHL